MSREGSLKSTSNISKVAFVLKDASSCWADVPSRNTKVKQVGTFFKRTRYKKSRALEIFISWKFFIVNTILVVPVQGKDMLEYLRMRNQQFWKIFWKKLELLQEILSTRVSVEQMSFSLGINIIHILSAKQPQLLILSPYLNYKCSHIMKPCYKYDPKHFCILLLNHDHMSWSTLLNLVYSKSSSTLANWTLPNDPQTASSYTVVASFLLLSLQDKT